MPKKRFVFTIKNLTALPTPETSPRESYYDTQTRGLGIYVTSTSIKTYFVYRRVHNRPERIILGRFNEISLEQARNKAGIVNAQIAEGLNPQDKKRAIRQETTLGELWALYLKRHAKIHRISWKYDEEIYRLYLKKWKNRKLSSIGTQQIRNVHLDIGREKGTVSEEVSCKHWPNAENAN